MAIPTLSGSYIDETYARLVQVSGSEYSDGLGNPITFGPGTLSGGIDGYIPIWSGSINLSNSIISQTGNQLTINGDTTAPTINTHQINPIPGQDLYIQIPSGSLLDIWTDDNGGEIVLNSSGILLQTNATANTWTFDKSGSLTAPGSISAPSFTGSLEGTASWAYNVVNLPTIDTGSFVLNSQTSSFVTNNQTSSFVQNSQTGSMTVLSSSYALTASYIDPLFISASAAYYGFGSGSIASGSINPTDNYIPFNNGGTFQDSFIYQTGSVLKTTSNIGGVTLLQTEDYLYLTTEDILSLTTEASDVGLKLDFNNDIYWLGDFDSVLNRTYIKVDDLNQTITLSGSVYIPGLPSTPQSNVLTYDTATGKLYFTASSAFGGNVDTSIFVLNSQTSSMNVLSSSYASTASYALNTQTIDTGSFVTNSQTSSFVQNSQTSSFVTNDQTGSFVTYLQTGSFATTGSNNFSGSQTITGSLSQGLDTIVSGSYSHAEGSITKAIGDYSHAEGDNTQAVGNYSHAEGQETIALGQYSHAEGFNTIASANHQHVQGQYNVTSSVQSAFIIGNGTDDGNRSNLIYAAGNEVQITGLLNVTNGITGSFTGSFVGDGSGLINLPTQSFDTSSFITYLQTGSFATTGSNTFYGTQTVTGSLMVTNGGITGSLYNRTFLKNQTTSDSINIIKSYENIFNHGDLLVNAGDTLIIEANAEYFILGDLINSGSVIVSGSLIVHGAIYDDGGVTGPGPILANSTIVTYDKGNLPYGFAKLDINGNLTSSITASYALTASHAITASHIDYNITTPNIPYISGGVLQASSISQQNGFINITGGTQNILGYDGYVKIWDGVYQPTTLNAAFGNFMINQNSYYDYYDDGKLKYINNGYAARIQIEPSQGQIVFRVAPPGIAGNELAELAALSIKNNGNIGINTDSPNFKLDVSGSGRFTNGLTVTGSLNITDSVSFTNLTSIAQQNVISIDTATGQLYYQPALSGSDTSSFLTNSQTASFATTGSNTFSGSLTITGSLIVTSEFTLDETLTKFAKYTNVGVGVANDVTLFTIPTGSYTSAFGKYTIYSGSNSRAGELMTSRNDTTINYTDVATNDIGSTSIVKLTSQVSESYYQIIASFPATGTWDIKMMATYI